MCPRRGRRPQPSIGTGTVELQEHDIDSYRYQHQYRYRSCSFLLPTQPPKSRGACIHAQTPRSGRPTHETEEVCGAWGGSLHVCRALRVWVPLRVLPNVCVDMTYVNAQNGQSQNGAAQATGLMLQLYTCTPFIPYLHVAPRARAGDRTPPCARVAHPRPQRARCRSSSIRTQPSAPIPRWWLRRVRRRRRSHPIYHPRRRYTAAVAISATAVVIAAIRRQLLQEDSSSDGPCDRRRSSYSVSRAVGNGSAQ